VAAPKLITAVSAPAACPALTYSSADSRSSRFATLLMPIEDATIMLGPVVALLVVINTTPLEPREP
jgi:hypothetical protein